MSENNTVLSLEAHGDVDNATTDDEPPLMKSPEVTLARPSEDDHVAIVRTNAPVSFLAIYDHDDRKSFSSDLHPLTTGDELREFWLDADRLTTATHLHVNTDDGRKIPAPEIHVEYRGWRGRVVKLLRDWKRRLLPDADD
ncbi:hypothetical protein [Halorubrum sp. CSM-61]|uniref:hypothetical protein n=1 Tax=Halorubrum sp. CSM-61 TaxID=2485838 RepID=UPI000F4C6B93|nr:hypothetical protein [Halorubrum sp. CSM-61]